jgi:hypothetical protein
MNNPIDILLQPTLEVVEVIVNPTPIIEIIVSQVGTKGEKGDKGDTGNNKFDIGLGNVDNTSDSNKPISIATQAALDEKLKILFKGDYFLWRPNSGTSNGNGINYPQQVSGTSSHPTLSSGSLTNRLRRTRITGAGTAGSTTGIRANVAQVSLTDGFLVQTRFALNEGINIAGTQAFIGLWANINALSADPSGLTNLIGIGFDAADSHTGNWFLIHNDNSGTATKVDIGGTMPRNSLDVTYDLIFEANPLGSSILVQLIDRHTETVILNTSINTNLPSASTFLTHHAELRNGSTTTVMKIDLMNIYGEVEF